MNEERRRMQKKDREGNQGSLIYFSQQFALLIVPNLACGCLPCLLSQIRFLLLSSQLASVGSGTDWFPLGGKSYSTAKKVSFL